jgi:GNAT superfamily N-acetyltransferase
MLKIDESKIPKKILDILRKGQGLGNDHDYCVAFSVMGDLCYRGTWDNGSVRFLHCVCKMIDDGTPVKGTEPLSGRRALKGWGTCDEDLWPSNVNLDPSEFEDWKRIPAAAWDDARQKQIKSNKAWSTSAPNTIVNIGGTVFRLFRFPSAFDRIGEGRGYQFNLTLLDSEFETVAWTILCGYVEKKRIVIEDLFVKPRFRRQNLGTWLLTQVEQICCRESVFAEFSKMVLAPIPIPDAGPVRYSAVKAFFQKNGYEWQNYGSIRSPLFYSIFTALKQLDCAHQVPV